MSQEESVSSCYFDGVVAVAIFLLTGIPYNKYGKEKTTLQYTRVSESRRKQKKHLREPTGSA